MASPSVLFGTMIVHIIFIAILGASTYGLGSQQAQGNTSSSLYKFAESGVIISAIVLFVTLSVFAYEGLS